MYRQPAAAQPHTLEAVVCLQVRKAQLDLELLPNLGDAVGEPYPEDDFGNWL
jgi:hypothetical protein